MQIIKFSFHAVVSWGSLEEFRKEVERTHGINTRYAKVYQAAADLAEIQILCKEVKEHEMQKDD